MEWHLNKLANPKSVPIRPTEPCEDGEYLGAIVDLAERRKHLMQRKPPPPADLMQPGGREELWIPIAVDGTTRWETGYVHCAVQAPGSTCNTLSSWWLMRSAETWECVYGAAQDHDFDGQLLRAQHVQVVDTKGEEREPHFCLLSDGKGQVLLAGCNAWTTEGEDGCVCWCCQQSRPAILRGFGLPATILAALAQSIRLTGVMRVILPVYRVPDFGLHGCLRCTVCGLKEHALILSQVTGLLLLCVHVGCKAL